MQEDVRMCMWNMHIANYKCTVAFDTYIYIWHIYMNVHRGLWMGPSFAQVGGKWTEPRLGASGISSLAARSGPGWCEGRLHAITTCSVQEGYFLAKINPMVRFGFGANLFWCESA